jgi:hypothetical protein
LEVRHFVHTFSKSGVNVLKRKLRAALTVVVALTLTGAVAHLGAERVAAATCITITRIYYNSPGTDTGSNASLNDEWVRLYNRCATGKALRNWKLKDAAGHTYTFGTYTLRAGRGVRIHTGKGTNTRTDRYWGQGWYIWNNDKDTARLLNGSGTLKDRCSYNNPNASSVYC